MVLNVRRLILALPRTGKRLVLVCFDAAALSLSMWASYALRFGRWTPPSSIDEWLLALSAPLVALPVFLFMGLYRAVVRHLPESAIWRMLQAVTLAVLLWVLLAFLSQLTGRGIVPRSVPIIYWALAAVSIVGSRFVAKWLFWPHVRRARRSTPPVLIYGAGDAGRQLAASLTSSHIVLGFLDDDEALQKRDVAGLKVYGPAALPYLIKEYGVKEVILSMPSLGAIRRKEILDFVSRHGVRVQSLPALADLMTGKYLVSQVRDIQIEDLLGRSSVPPDEALIRQMVVGRTIMVTGAGGSIGSELCRKIAQWRPQRLVLFEANEFALYCIDREITSAFKDIAIVPILASVVNGVEVERALKQNRIDVVFHAAAHKHVPLVEANVLEGIRNNVFGTKTIVDAALRCGVKHFVLISTDKAVRPTNVMGATKRWAELVVREAAFRAAGTNGEQRFCAVRFGNVLGSNGSVVPLFKEQIAAGGPVTVTDFAMTRYFMSIAEAAELIIQAGALSEGGDVFLLDMGEPILISHLAENMVRLAGLTIRSHDNPDGDIEIVAVGKRPGEKLYEELFYDQSSATDTRHPKIMRGPALAAKGDLIVSGLDRLREAVAQEDEPLARSILFEVVSKSDRAEITFAEAPRES